MIQRNLGPHLTALAERMPVVAVTGPRQSGKMTLCKSTFPNHPYVSLEPLDTPDFTVQDPRGVVSEYPGGVVLDGRGTELALPHLGRDRLRLSLTVTSTAGSKRVASLSRSNYPANPTTFAEILLRSPD